MSDNYIPYGEEWEKEMSKFPKAQLIKMLGNALQSRSIQPSSDQIAGMKEMLEAVKEYFKKCKHFVLGEVQRDVEAIITKALASYNQSPSTGGVGEEHLAHILSNKRLCIERVYENLILGNVEEAVEILRLELPITKK